ncbi:PEP-CTERM sorting domain-containing protein [Tsuneonella amylolytica]|uniref:PEP-CTERM sorting domain-containing protein n=1 Tax=Tsuneonella amylolytica TaxID=2338327 RepID=UPI00389AB7A6
MGLLIGVVLATSQIPGSSDQTLSASAGDVLKSFLERSPGARGIVDIIKGRAARVEGDQRPPPSEIPTQRALGKIFETAPEAVVGGDVPPTIFLPDDIGAASDTIVPIADVGSLPNLPTGGANSVGSGGLIGGPGGGIPGVGGSNPGGGTGAPSPAPPAPTIPDVESAVPEPGTWLLLIFGFAACGAELRRNRRRRLIALSG